MLRPGNTKSVNKNVSPSSADILNFYIFISRVVLCDALEDNASERSAFCVIIGLLWIYFMLHSAVKILVFNLFRIFRVFPHLVFLSDRRWETTINESLSAA